MTLPQGWPRSVWSTLPADKSPSGANTSLNSSGTCAPSHHHGPRWANGPDAQVLGGRRASPAHVAAFRYFGGVPRRLVPNNLKTRVDKPDLYDPKINKAYAELATHYGALVEPARAA